MAVATDERPPSQPRFRGLRFQITVVYWGTIAPLEDWETSSDPPILVCSSLGDIMHCPGKKRVDVSRILEKQLARMGLNCFDVVSCTGDGGGEKLRPRTLETEASRSSKMVPSSARRSSGRALLPLSALGLRQT